MRFSPDHKCLTYCYRTTFGCSSDDTYNKKISDKLKDTNDGQLV